MTMNKTVLLGLTAALVAGCTGARPRAIVDDDQVPGNSFVVRNVRVFDGERVHERADVGPTTCAG
jgi:hypothetical protein